MKIWNVLIIVLIFSTCKNESSHKQATQVVNQGALSAADIQELVRKTDYVDFLFYHMNISVSQNDLASISQSVQFFTPSAKPASMDCPAIGRISLQSKGKIILEADIHVTENCGYFGIIENKVEKGTSFLSPDGMKFLLTLINGYKTK